LRKCAIFLAKSRRISLCASGIPDVLKQVDRVAKREKTTRSGFITQVLCEVTKAANRAEITTRINELFGERSPLDEQRNLSNEFLLLRAAESDDGESKR
jgi:hypothetical protein